MEAFAKSLASHGTSVINLMLMRRMDTGDRMLDTTLQMLFSTLIGGILSGLVTLYLQPGIWSDMKHRALATVKAASYNPLQFDPAGAPGKPRNGISFFYKTHVPYSQFRLFMSWFLENHADKMYSLKLDKSWRIPQKKDDNDHLDAMVLTPTGRNAIPAGSYLPIWRSKDGDYVYATTRGDIMEEEGVEILSDSMKTLQDCVQSLSKHKTKMEKYEEEMAAKAPKRQAIREFGSHAGGLDTVGYINPNKTFETLFFTQKEEVMGLLTRFKEGNLFGKHMPVDNKLGFILYGPPGTGKTGLIAAIANYLGLCVKLVDMSRIKTRTALDNILFTRAPAAGGEAAKELFVFEEFDCMPGIQRRDVEDDKSSVASNPGGLAPTGAMGSAAELAMMMMAAAGGGKKDDGDSVASDLKRRKREAEDALDLGYLLRKLDGLESGEGRIIIATTNHPERIDPALMRPGRFGLQIHLTRCTPQMLLDIVAMIYQIEGGAKEELALGLKGIPEFKWAPAEVLQLGITYSKVEDLVEHLKTAVPDRERWL